MNTAWTQGRSLGMTTSWVGPARPTPPAPQRPGAPSHHGGDDGPTRVAEG